MRALPGERRVWLTAAVVLAALAIPAALALLTPRDHYTGTNSVRLRSFVAELQPGTRLCVPDLVVPAGTGRVEFASDAAPHLGLTVDVRGRSGTRTGRAEPTPAGVAKIAVPIPERPEAETATVCVRPTGGSIRLGGMAGLQSDMEPGTLGGEEFRHRLAVWFRPPAGEERTLASLLPTTWERAARFRPGWVGPWTYGVLLLLVAPLVAYASLRLLAGAFAGSRSRVPAALAVGLVAFANAAAWATLTPTFNAPDEIDHFAYVQTLAENGARPNPFASDRPPHSTEETLAVDAVRLLSSAETPDGKPPWRASDERRWEERVRAFGGRPAQDDGGGVTTAATHQAGYYGLAAPAYLAASGGSIWTEVWAARLVSALLGAVVALFTVLFIREVLPGRPAVAVLGGLLVAFLPQFTFISGAVNNDNGVNAAAAVALWLAARALRRGLTWRSGLGLGAALVALTTMKQTGYALYPALGLAVAGSLWRRHDRAALVGLAALAGAFLAARGVWAQTGGAVATIDDPPVGDGGAVVGASTAITQVLDAPGLFASYAWQTFLPRLPFMTDLFVQRWPAFDVYVERGFAALGWYAHEFPRWVYAVIVVVMAGLSALALRALWGLRRRLRTRWMEVAVVGLAIAGVLGGVAAIYMQPVARPPSFQPEQGRYAFTVLAPLAAVAALAVAGLGRRAAPVVAAGTLAGMIGLQIATLLLAFAGFYT